MMTHLHSHVPTSGDDPTDVRERIDYSIILTYTCPLNSLLKIKKKVVLTLFTPFLWLLMRKPSAAAALFSLNPGDAQGIQYLGDQGG
jgi:hypothetical protein